MNQKEKTIFEKIVDREIPAEIIYEDENNIAFLNAFPFEKGHLLVIPKKPYQTIFDMPEDEFLNLQKAIYKIAKNVREKTEKDVAIFQRNGIDAGQEVPHVHFHILPRWTSEENNPVFNDGNSNLIDESEKKEMAELLRM